MKKLMCGLALVSLSGCVNVPPAKYYSGPELPKEKLSTYSLWNYSGFFSSVQIYTMEVNGRNMEALGSVGGIPAPGGMIYLAPGKQKIKVSFVDSSNYLIPSMLQMNTFAGWYEFDFETKPNMFYAPIFNKKYKGKDMVKEMCIAEVSSTEGVSATRDTTNYVACVEPNLAPTEENRKLCESSWSAHNMAACKH